MSELTETSPGFPQRLHEELIEALADNEQMKENLERVRHQFLRLEYEDSGWKRILGGSGFGQDSVGLELRDLHTISQKLREEIAGSALPKRANEARYAYTFGKAFMIEGLDDRKPRTRGKPTALQSFSDKESARRHVFSDEAKFRMHAATSTDGIYLLVGNDLTREVNSIPISQVANVMTNPDFNDEVWAYLRKWDRTRFNPSTGVQETETVTRWIYTDAFKGTRASKIGEDPVDQNSTIIDAVVNRQAGWTFGVPDLMAGQIWNQKYLTMIAYGEQVTETLAYFAAKVKVNSQPGSNNVGLKIGGAGREKGQVVTYGAGNEIDVFSTAGKAYDFGSLRVFAGFYAASVGIPLTDLTADPSAAGASYGSAQALQPGARRLIEARRSYWADWYKRVLKWATGKDYNVAPESIEEIDAYRLAQSNILAWNSGLFHPEEVRPALAAATGVRLLHPTAPEGVMLPNNEEFEMPEEPEAPVQAASPDQGQSNNTGGQDDAQKKDLRTDTIQDA